MVEWTQETMDDLETRNLDSLERARGIAYMRSVKQADEFHHVENSADYYFKINDWVKLKRHDSKKLECSWKGPYFVVDVGFPGTYWLMDPNGRRLDATVNQSDLAPWRVNIEDNQSFFHDGTLRSTLLLLNLIDLALNLELSLFTLCDQHMGDCVIAHSDPEVSCVQRPRTFKNLGDSSDSIDVDQ
jgi:hypothetical protein